MDNELMVGIYEDPTTGLSLKVVGNAFYSAQLISNSTLATRTIKNNVGNLVIVQNAAGAPYTVILPSSLAQEGHQYTICIRSAGAITFNAGGGILVNGLTSWLCPNVATLPPSATKYVMLQAFYTSIAGSGEWLIG